MEKVVTKVDLKLSDEELAALKTAANLIMDIADACETSEVELTLSDELIKILSVTKETINSIVK